MNKNLWIGYTAAFFATVIWAGNFVVARAFAWSISPCLFNFLRWTVAFFVILPFGLTHLKKDIKILNSKFGYISLMALLGVTLMNAFIYQAGKTTESLNMALIMPATPALIMILARFVYKEPVTIKKCSGLLLCLAGIVILISRGEWSRIAKMEFQEGDIWTIGCMLCFALYSLFMRKRPREVSAAGFNIIVFGLGIFYAIPFVLAELFYLPAPNFSWPLAAGILYAGAGCSAMAFWLWTIGIDRIGPVAAGFVYYLLPVFAAIMAKIILDENVVKIQIIGGIMIIGGIALASMPKIMGRK